MHTSDPIIIWHLIYRWSRTRSDPMGCIYYTKWLFDRPQWICWNSRKSCWTILWYILSVRLKQHHIIPLEVEYSKCKALPLNTLLYPWCKAEALSAKQQCRGVAAGNPEGLPWFRSCQQSIGKLTGVCAGNAGVDAGRRQDAAQARRYIGDRWGSQI